jgi:hypothetical protein
MKPSTASDYIEHPGRHADTVPYSTGRFLHPGGRGCGFKGLIGSAMLDVLAINNTC